ncbi:hypothetical protein HYT84_04900, partial [Candidatus Micrarchaeota archaeon]|nr:hypothetical protein [Candidatus Micrarchaeota archaeon]
IGIKWPHYKIDNSRFLSFDSPNDISDGLKFQEVDSHKWKEMDTINGIKSENIVKSLLQRSIQTVCLSKGLEEYKEEVEIKNTNRKKIKTIRLFFPNNLLPKDKITFKNYNRKKVPVSVCGQRIGCYINGMPEYFKYHLYNFI